MTDSEHAAPFDLITISREYGSGGSDFARALGEALGWRVLDRDIVHFVAERLHLDDATVARLDEHPPSLLSRLSVALLMAPPESPASLDTSRLLSPDAVADAVHAAIVDAAGRPPLIVVGHGSQCIFHTRPGTLHMRLVAPLEYRVKQVAARARLDLATVPALARRMDEGRDRYVIRYYHHDRRDPLLYDLQINTARVPIAGAVGLVRQMLGAPREAASARGGGSS